VGLAKGRNPIYQRCCLLGVEVNNTQSDAYDVATATTLAEDQELLKTGFQYVTERDGIKIYRKPKIFSNC